MEITEIRVKLMDSGGDKLHAFCTLTLENKFVIRDLKIIGGRQGAFVAMPSRKLTDRCRRCGSKNHLRARYCNECGSRLDPNRALRDEKGRAKLHMDIAHPINSICREEMQNQILKAFEAEKDRARLPGYRPVDLGGDYDFEEITYPESTDASSQA